MNTPITETALSRRVTNALCRYGLFTVGEVVEYHNAHDISTIRSVGADAIKEINDIILIPNGFGIPPKHPRIKKEKSTQQPSKRHMKRNEKRQMLIEILNNFYWDGVSGHVMYFTEDESAVLAKYLIENGVTTSVKKEDTRK